MYWPDEDSVSTVSAAAVRGHCTMTVGEQCKVSVSKKDYNGKVAAKGKNIIYTYFTYKKVSQELGVKWKSWKISLLLESGYHHLYNPLQLQPLKEKNNKQTKNTKKEKRE